MRRTAAALLLVLVCAAVAVADEQDDATAAKANCEKVQADCGQLRNSVANICGLALGEKGAAYDKYWAKRYKMSSQQRAWCEAVLMSADGKYTEGDNLWNQASQSDLAAQNTQSNATSMFALFLWLQATGLYEDAMNLYLTAALDFADAGLRYDDVRVMAYQVSEFCDSIP